MGLSSMRHRVLDYRSGTGQRYCIRTTVRGEKSVYVSSLFKTDTSNTHTLFLFGMLQSCEVYFGIIMPRDRSQLKMH